MRSNEEIDRIYSKSQLMEKINLVSRWTHKIKLGSLTTPGRIPDKVMNAELAAIPSDLTDKTVLDIGTRDGGWAFECERRKAKK